MPEDSSLPSNKNAPYETALNKAFEKLSSEIFIFLLAYMILLIGLAVLTGIPETLRTLLYILPILGIVAYAWLKKRSIRRSQDPANQVKAGFVSGHGRVTGLQMRGYGPAPANPPLHNQVEAGIVKDRARVTGVDIEYGPPARQEAADQPNDINLGYLTYLFNHTDDEGRAAIIDYARRRQKKAGQGK